MRDIWALQSRFSYRTGKRAKSVFEHPKFRAGYDFLCLRAKAGEDVSEDCQWWTEFQEKSPEAQHKKVTPKGRGRSRRRRRTDKTKS